MLFNSIDFIVFLAIVLTAYHYTRSYIHQNWLLLGASYVFYAWWDWRYLGLLIWISIVDYFVSVRISEVKQSRYKKIWFCVSLVNGLSILSFYKYYDFFAKSIQDGFERLGVYLSVPLLNVILPIALSFFIFDSLSFVFDVYRGETKRATKLHEYLLFVAFFPKLIAGPIERSQNLFKQIQSSRAITADDCQIGLAQFLYGWLKKVAIADHLGVYVDTIYSSYSEHNGVTLSIATMAFALQIYCDFSAYSDMAIGIGKFFGFKLMENFNAPYLAVNIQDFWRRWHISLSTWFRDYLYIPLGGAKQGFRRQLLNIMIVFLVSGVWHGANWTFFFWGLAHGLLLCYFVFWRRHKPVWWSSNWYFVLMSWGFTFSAVLLTWVFFRAQSLSQAFEILARMSNDFGKPFLAPSLYSAALPIILLFTIELLKEPESFYTWFMRKGKTVQLFLMAALLTTGLLFCAKSGGQFIYFQF